MIQGWEPAHVSILSGILVALLGGVVFVRNPGRGLNRAFFAFTVLHGVSIVLSALVDLAPGTAAALTWTRIFWYFDPWMTAVLIILALHVPTTSGVVHRHPVLVHAALLVPPAILSVAYARDPGVFIRLASVDGTPYYALTSLGVSLIGLRALAAGFAVAFVAQRFRRTPHPLQRTQLSWMQAALLVAFVPIFALYLVKQFTYNPFSPAVWGFLAATIIVNASALWALSPWNGSLLRDPDRQVVTVSYIASCAAALSLALVASPGVEIIFTAVVALAYPLMIAYAILKFDLFDLNLRIRNALPKISLGVLILVAFGLFLGLATNVSTGTPAMNQVLAAGVLTAASAIPLHSANTRLMTRLGLTSPPGSVARDRRRLELYRAAMENAVTREEDVDASASLHELRARLGVTEREHRMVAGVVKDVASAPAVPEGPLRQGDVLLKKYRVERFLGAGSYGRTVLATQVNVDRPVVIKEPNEALRSRGAIAQLGKEARLAAKVRHPNVVSLIDFEEANRNAYLIFEYVGGGSLEDRLKNGPLPRDEAYALFRGLLRGLTAIHRSSIVHMDLKPANILLDDDGQAKIADFGIAREIRMEVATLGRTAGPNAHPGTLLYMAPEQVRGRRDPGPKADLYAAGAIFHEMLTGKRYLDFPDSPHLIQDAILYKEPRLDDPRLTPAEQDLLHALLSKAPADRPPSAEAVLATLPHGSEENVIAADSAARPLGANWESH